MKRTLLSITSLALITIGAMAMEHTIVFDGENDMYGLVRQTTDKVNSMEFVQDFSFTEEGIDFSITKTDGTGSGFALVNAGGDKAGIYISSKIDTKVTLTVPKGNITAVKIYMTGYALGALDVTFNKKAVESSIDGSNYYWAWSDKAGAETVTLEWPSTFMARYIHSIELTYTTDLGGKQECGLSFTQKNAEAVLGKQYTAPALNNPNKLPLSWTSSNENIATVDANGKVTLIAVGKTAITASTEGNDVYAAGSAKYELSVIPSAESLTQLLALAPEVHDRVNVNFPATVTFASTNFAFVTDPEGNAGYFENIKDKNSTSSSVSTIYKVGDVIPAGWIATNATIYESVIWEGIPPTVTETTEIVYSEVSSVSPEDVDKVVILKGVKFETRTAEGNTKAYGTTPDGTRYEFQDTYNIGSKPAGTYDVTCVVRYSKVGSTVYFYLSPIAYTESADDPNAIDGASITDKEARYYDMQGNIVANPETGMYIKVANGRSTTVIVR